MIHDQNLVPKVSLTEILERICPQKADASDAFCLVETWRKFGKTWQKETRHLFRAVGLYATVVKGILCLKLQDISNVRSCFRVIVAL